MPVDFPASPALNSTFVSGSLQYKWDGVAWISLGGGGGTAPMPDTSITFTGSPMVYGRTQAGAGEGHEISVGPWLNTTSTTIDGQPGIRGYALGGSSYSSILSSNTDLFASDINTRLGTHCFVAACNQQDRLLGVIGSYNATIATKDQEITIGSQNCVGIASDKMQVAESTTSATLASTHVYGRGFIENSDNTLIAASTGIGLENCSNMAAIGTVGGAVSNWSNSAFIGAALTTGATQLYTPATFTNVVCLAISDLILGPSSSSAERSLVHGTSVSPRSDCRIFNYAARDIRQSTHVIETSLKAVQVGTSNVWEFETIGGKKLSNFIGPLYFNRVLVEVKIVVDMGPLGTPGSTLPAERTIVYEGKALFRSDDTPPYNTATYNGSIVRTHLIGTEPPAGTEINWSQYTNNTSVSPQLTFIIPVGSTELVYAHAYLKVVHLMAMPISS